MKNTNNKQVISVPSLSNTADPDVFDFNYLSQNVKITATLLDLALEGIKRNDEIGNEFNSDDFDDLMLFWINFRCNVEKLADLMDFVKHHIDKIDCDESEIPDSIKDLVKISRQRDKERSLA